jgi:hypothetical protein
MICKFNITFNQLVSHSYKINPSSFYYKNKKVDIISHADNLKFYQFNSKLPFLYSSKQVLNVDAKTDIYELKYKIGEYHNDILLIEQRYDSLYLDKCSVQGKELICKINKKEIEEYVYYNGQRLEISFYKYTFDNDSVGILLDNSNYGIYVNYSLNKKDVYIEITKLVENVLERNNLVTYVTNVTDITNVNSKEFNLDLSDGTQINCFLKKSERTSLIMVCHLKENYKKSFRIGEIKQQINLKDINIKYNFFILPVINNYDCFFSDGGAIMRFTFPKILDFTSKDAIIVDFFINYKEHSNNMTLNPYGGNIICRDGGGTRRRCLIRRSHFKGQISGYYLIHHLNHYKRHTAYYEASPIKVLLPESNEITLSIYEMNNKNHIKIGNDKRVFAFISNYNDKERNIFDNNTNINFTGELRDIYYEKIIFYNVTCRLWKPDDDYMRIICEMNKNLNHTPEFLYLNRTSFSYKNYTIFIEQEQTLIFKQYNEIIPFLYSDKQIINIYDNIPSYELKFKSEAFNGNTLYIYGSNNNYAILDNCKSNETEVICSITKERIEEILTSKNEKFKIGAIIDNSEIQFDHILDITINYENVRKEDIYFKIIKTIGGITEAGTPFAYETNITEFPTFISQIFNEKEYFKKIPGRPLLYFVNYKYGIHQNRDVNITKEHIIDNAHYKYIFRLQPCSYHENISVSGTGTNILLAYPQKIDFTSTTQAKMIIRFIVDEPKFMNYLKLNLNSQSN